MTPSPGLELAAGFIASAFRQAGLQPAPDGTYFQTDNLIRVSIPHDSIKLHTSPAFRYR